MEPEAGGHDLKSLLILSLVLVSLIAPAITARMKNPRRGLRVMVVAMGIYTALYVFYMTQVHPFVFVPKWP